MGSGHFGAAFCCGQLVGVVGFLFNFLFWSRAAFAADDAFFRPKTKDGTRKCFSIFCFAAFCSTFC